jgi:hypothetical protein
MIDFARENSQLMENLEYLSDVIGPRLTGTERMKRANEWAAQKMREFGLENVHLESYTIPIGWERVRCEARVLEPNGMQLTAFAVPWTPGTRGTVTGPVVFFDARDETDFERFRGRLKNAAVLLSRPNAVQHHPSRSNGADVWANRPIGGGTTEVHQHGGHEGRDAAGAWARQRAESARDAFFRKEGVAAILQDTSKPQTLVAVTGAWRADGSRPDLPRVYLANEHYSMLFRLAQRKQPVRLQLRVENRWIKGPVTVYNTVGEIRGTERPEEVVLCGAHLDSWDLAQGTVDNGTGSVVVLETARLMKAMGLKPKRTVRFVLFSGEEQGLHGSQAYVNQHKNEMERISAVFVHDTGTGRVTGFGLHGNPQAQPVLERELGVLKELGVTRYVLPPMGGTDHAPFAAERVPAFWFVQEPADYSLMHHTQSDTFDKALKDDLIQGAAVMAISALNVANLPEILPRRPASAR